MICKCGGQIKTKRRTVNALVKEVGTCVGCGRRIERYYRNGKLIFLKG